MARSDESPDALTREAFQLALQLMSARTLNDELATRVAVQDITGFLAEDLPTSPQRSVAHIEAHGHLAAFLVHAAAGFAHMPVEHMLHQVTLYASTRLNDPFS